jgi:hypothetical protein
MRYTVVWLRDAENRLADLYNRAADKRPVTDACNRIDVLLREDPEKVAEPFGKFYVLTVEPLSVLFHVDPGDCMVRVVSVRRSS